MSALMSRSPGRRRRVLPALLATAVAAGLVLTVPTVGEASPGPAPAPSAPTVVAKAHADAMATFLDEGSFELGTTADTPAPGTRYGAADVWFHVDDASQLTLPAGFGFVGAEGSEVWIAPEANPGGDQLWPGFSTQGVPTGGVDGDSTTLILEAVSGPGDVEVYSGSGAGLTRLWSSDEALKSFTMARAHRHANWAFTAAGIYRLTVRAEAAIGGVAVSDSATYTFVVGDLPEAVSTTTALAASATTLVAGAAVTLTADVAPVEVEGHVEFRDGAAVLGHAEVVDGEASIEVGGLSLGTHRVTAVFVPRVILLAAESTSEPVRITVTDDSGTEFAVTGIADEYHPGEVLEARVAGVTPTEGQVIEWRLRPTGTAHAGTVLSRFVPSTDTPDSRAGRLDLPMDASYDGYELQAALMEGETQVGATVWAGPIVVQDAVEPLSLGYDGPTPFLLGDTASLVATGRDLAEGESLRVVINAFLSHFSLWTEPGVGIYEIDERTFAFEPTNNGVYPLALQVVRDGLVVAQSDLLDVDFLRYEFLFEGMQPVYRAGQTFSAKLTVAPDLGDEVTYSWAMYDDYENPMKVASGNEGRTFEMPITADLNGKRMFIAATVVYESGRTAQVGGAYPVLTVTEDTGQIFLFSALSDHYHQGAPVSLQLTADPGLVEGDSVAWEWRWPGRGWETLPDAQGLSHQVTAEQALDGVEVRASLSFADPALEPMVAGPVAIQVDDHGSLPVQQVNVTGPTSYAEGDATTLAAQVSPATVLETFRWERRAAGSSEWEILEARSTAELSFAAGPDDDGASYRVSVLKPDGSLAYGPSAPTTLTVSPGESEAAPTSVHAAALTQTYGRSAIMVVSVLPATAIGTVAVRFGRRTLTAKVRAGRAAIAVPARILEPGRYRGEVLYSGAAGEFERSTGTAVVAVPKATPLVAVKAPKRVKRGSVAVIRVAVRAFGVTGTGRVTVKVAGKSRTVALRDGRATVRIRMTRTRLGQKLVRVTYAGTSSIRAGEAAPESLRVIHR